jgi:cell division septal protein FtsQ
MGAIGMVTLTILLFWLLTDESFRVDVADVRIDGLRLTDETAVREHLGGLERSPNAFRIRASELVADLLALPEIASASATVTLPAQVAIALEEREPILAWSDGSRTWLVDREGTLFAPGSLIDPADLELPAVEDARLADVAPTEGTRLPATDLAVMRQLLTLTPESLGSRAGTLRLRVDEHDGYVLQSDRGWQAIFGHYTPTLQPPEVVPRQVQCLSWLLASRERQLERVRLSPSEDGCGTFTEVGQTG